MAEAARETADDAPAITEDRLDDPLTRHVARRQVDREWRETFDPDWQDPFPTPAADPGSKRQPDGLKPFDPTATTNTGGPLLPPVSILDQPFSDGVPTTPDPPTFASAATVYEDDLIMTGVRSFDIKAYDNVFVGYVDLGWGDDLRLYQQFYPPGTPPGAPPYLRGTHSLDAAGIPIATAGRKIIVWPPNQDTSVLPPVAQRSYDLIYGSYAHEGRIPPLGNDTSGSVPPFTDNRIDPQAAGYNRTFDVGNNDNRGVIRLRRVWDSWSTDYTQAPASGYDSSGVPAGLPFSDPAPSSFPRSFPPPYPMPLRGIQIQIRVVDPRNEHIKVLTIRQDFTDKL